MLFLTSAALATADGTPTETMQAVLDAEDHRRFDDEIFATALTHRSLQVRTLATQALGRIGAPESVAALILRLDDRAPAVREQAAFALGLIATDAARAAIAERLDRATGGDERHAAVRQQLYLALGRIGKEADLALLADGLSERTPVARAGAGQALGLLFMKHPTLVPTAATVDRLVALAERGAVARDETLGAAFALARLRAPLDAAQGAALVNAFTRTRDAAARLLLTRALGRLTLPEARAALLGAATAPTAGQRVEALRVLGTLPVADAHLAALQAAVDDAVPQVAVQAMLSAAQIGLPAASLAPTLTTLFRGGRSPWLRGQALETLAVIAPDVAQPLALAELQQTTGVIPAALRALGKRGDAAAVIAITPFLGSPHRSESGAAAEALAGVDAALLALHAKDALRTALLRADLALTSYVAEIAGRATWRDFVPPLLDVYGRLNRPDDLEAKIAILSALGQLGDAQLVPFLEGVLGDDQRTLGLAAAAAIQALTGDDVTDRVARTSRVRGITPPLADLRAAARARVRLETDKGVIVLAMRAEAPLTAYNFVQLARRGFYDGKSFHRVVPGFVAQGGDPRGDGFGGPGYLIRDEVSTLSHRRGAVGIATAGKDTGGCQLFIDHAANLHLDGAYTVFAEVQRGMDVVDRLEVGDLIRQADVVF